MMPTSLRRFAATAAKLMLVLLAVSVVAWGAGYKMSLYRATEPARAQVPSAKLLTGRELKLFALDAAPAAGELPARVMLKWDVVPAEPTAEALKLWRVESVAERGPWREPVANRKLFSRPPPFLS